MLKENRTFQFIVGVFVIAMAVKCYPIIEHLWIVDDSEGFNSAGLLVALASAAVSAVQLVGVCAILICSGLQPLAEKAVDYLRGLFPKASAAADKVETVIDAAKLNEVLTKLDDRIKSLTEKVEGKK